ncbi:MAG TPA: hypothetical protein VNQ76_20275 [Planctomicrobium sp.]|nr:hypothetical protein [Planctomicrobium sp.]
MRLLATVLTLLVLYAATAQAEPVKMQIFQTATAPAPLMVSLFSASTPEDSATERVSLKVDLFAHAPPVVTPSAGEQEVKSALPAVPVSPPPAATSTVGTCVNGRCYYTPTRYTRLPFRYRR